MLRLHLHTFCSVIWERQKVFHHDLDANADDTVVLAMGRLTGVDIPTARSTSLYRLRGNLLHPQEGGRRWTWVVRTGVRRADRTLLGEPYCPACLWTDEVPYLRLRWRLGFVTCCLRHRVVLQSTCFACGTPTAFWRLNAHTSAWPWTCGNCGADLRQAPRERALPEVVRLQRQLERTWETASAPDGQPSIAVSTQFRLLHGITAILARGPHTHRLRAMLAAERQEIIHSLSRLSPRFPVGSRAIERLSPEARHALIGLSGQLMADWPAGLLRASDQLGIPVQELLTQVPTLLHPVRSVLFGQFETPMPSVDHGQTTPRYGRPNGPAASVETI